MTRRSTSGRRASAFLVAAATLVLATVAGRASADPPHTCADSGQTYIEPTSDGPQPVGRFSPEDVEDDGFSDLIEGVPTAASGAGAVDIHYDLQNGDEVAFPGDPFPLEHTQRIKASYFQGVSASAGDAFGSASAFVSADTGYCADLAIGAPGADGGRGKVVIGLGSLGGIDRTGAITIRGATTGEHFGTAIAADGNDLWVGAPYRTVAGASGAGAIDHYRISAGRATLLETLTEATPGIPGSPEAGDHFGHTLVVNGHTDDLTGADPETLVIGEPAEDIGTKVDAGSVTVVRESRTTHTMRSAITLSQNSVGVPGVAESYDHFGSSVSIHNNFEDATLTYRSGAFIAVGVPGEDLGRMSDAGVVQAFFYPSSGTTAPIGTVTQNTPGEPGAAEAGDRFGASVFVGGISDLYYAGTTDFGFENIAVGVPGEDVGGNSDQGVVDVFALLPRQGSPSVRPRSWVYFQGSPSGHVGGTAAAGDDFGAGLTGMPVDGRDRFSSDFGGTRLNVAVPGKDVAGAVDSGEVVTTWISPAPNTATVVDSAGPVAHERYGTGAANTIGGGVAYAFD